MKYTGRMKLTHIQKYSAKLIVLSAVIVLTLSETSDAAAVITTTLVPLLNDSTESVTVVNNSSNSVTDTTGDNDTDTSSSVSNDNGLIEVTMSNNHKPPRGSIVVSNEIDKSVQQVSSLTRSVKRDTSLGVTSTVSSVTGINDDTGSPDASTTSTMMTMTMTTIDDASSTTTNSPVIMSTQTVGTMTESTDNSVSVNDDLSTSTVSESSVTVTTTTTTTTTGNNEVEGDPVSTEPSTTIDTLIDELKCFNSTKQWQLNVLRRIQVTLDNVKFQLDSTLGSEGASRRDLLRRALSNLMTLQSRVLSRDPETSEEESQVGLLMNAEGRLNRIGWVVYRNRKDWDFNDCCYQGLNFMCGSRKKMPLFEPR